MFTGIIEEIGRVKNIAHRKNLSQITIAAKKVLKGVKPGDSLAVNGACLTVVKKSAHSAVFDMMQETLLKTNLGLLKKGDPVNLERPMSAKARVHGHFVTGHIDDVCAVKKILKPKNYIEVQIEIKKSLKPFLVPKGSVCVDGVSLTVGKIEKTYFSVYLIPFSLRATTLGKVSVKTKVNIEADILAKYMLRQKTK